SPDGDRKAERDEAVGIGTDHPAPRHVHAAMHVPAAAPTEPTVAFRRRRLPPPLSPPHEGDPAKHGGGGGRRARVKTPAGLRSEEGGGVYPLTRQYPPAREGPLRCGRRCSRRSWPGRY